MSVSPRFPQINIRSPVVVTIVYNIAAFAALIIFRLMYPDFETHTVLLEIFLVKARFLRGVLSYLDMYPAIFMASLLIPFALTVYGKRAEKRFSPVFFDFIKPNLFCAVAGALVYALLYLIAYPLLNNYQLSMQSQSRLYYDAREKALSFAEKELWAEAAGFLTVCEQIWEKNSAMDALKDRVLTSLERERYGRNTGQQSAGNAGNYVYSGRENPLEVTEALALARKALNERRYYDAHWLANTAARMAHAGSVESAEALRLGSLAWNAISLVETTPGEEALFALYRRKREGYEALVNREWLRAYYIFNALLAISPSDPDIQNFLQESKKGLLTTAFFIDEMDMVAGDAQTDIVFSIPGDGPRGRIVARFNSLTFFSDRAFGRGLEAIGFSSFNEPVWRLSCPLVKMYPISLEDRWYTVLILHAVDRNDAAVQYKPEWADGITGADGYQLLVPVSFEKLQLAAKAWDGAGGFFIHDLWNAADELRDMGYISQYFAVEILRIIVELSFFLPFAVFSLVSGWKFRALFRVRYALYPMYIVLPLMCSLLSAGTRIISNTLSIWALVSYSLITCVILAVGAAVLLFVISLFLLAAQRSEN